MTSNYLKHYFPFEYLGRLSILVQLILLMGCATDNNFPIREHTFKITDLRESAAQEIISKIEASQYNIYIENQSLKTKVDGEEVNDYTFTISDPNYTNSDIASVVNQITGQDRRDPVVLRSTKIVQEYSSASGAGTAQVRLRIDITQNAKAYYKETGYPIDVKWGASGNTAWFTYDRRENEEYVDIYILPLDTSADSKPKKFQRISLHAPYTAQILDWKETWFGGW
ncbi:MAG: hypothetical protein V3U75_11895 [Methylococcaceae bacterium]